MVIPSNKEIRDHVVTSSATYNKKSIRPILYVSHTDDEPTYVLLDNNRFKTDDDGPMYNIDETDTGLTKSQILELIHRFDNEFEHWQIGVANLNNLFDKVEQLKAAGCSTITAFKKLGVDTVECHIVCYRSYVEPKHNGYTTMFEPSLLKVDTSLHISNTDDYCRSLGISEEQFRNSEADNHADEIITLFINPNDVADFNNGKISIHELASNCSIYKMSNAYFADNCYIGRKKANHLKTSIFTCCDLNDNITIK